MKALLRSELRQARWLLPLGAALSLLLVMARVLVLPRLYTNLHDADLFCAGVLGIAPIFFGISAAAGLVAREKSAGTLPLLLTLPLSRTRLWLVKVLAGVLLFLGAWAALLLPAALLAPRVLTAVDLPAFYPDTLLWGLSALALTLLASTLSERPISALLGGLLFAFALFAGAAYIVSEWGALAGWQADGFFDDTLWAGLALPAALLGSWMAFRGGELLSRRRKWLLAVPTLALVLVAEFWLVTGLAHHHFRYQRAGVREIRAPVLSSGRAIGLVALASPTPWERTYTHGWQRPKKPRYRARHFVFVDADSRKELLTVGVPESGVPGDEAAVSPDGRDAALLAQPEPRTWGTQEWSLKRTLQVWDLRAHRLLYSGLPPADPQLVNTVKWSDIPDLSRASWSPDGKWLAMWAAASDIYGTAPGEARLLTMRPDGTQMELVDLPAPQWLDSLFWKGGGVRSYAWAPDSRSVYFLDRKAGLVKRAVPHGRPQVLWPGTFHGDEWCYAELSVSPDGKRIALGRRWGWSRQLWRSEEEARGTPWDLAVGTTDGSRGCILARGTWGPGLLHPTWSPDGRVLFFMAPDETVPKREGWQTVMRWRVDEARPEPVVASRRRVHLAVLHTGQALLWGGGPAVLVGEHGPAVAVANPEAQQLAREHELVGLTRADEPILRLSARDLGALDLRTGAVRRIYP